MYEFIRSAVAIQVIAAAGAAAALMAVLMFQRSRRAAGKDALSGGTLRRPESRIRAMARLGQDKPTGAADQLEPCWYSIDPDARYFSLYFSSACADGPLQKEWLRRAVLAAPFCGGRRAEMLRTLGLSNAVLQQKAEESGRGGADMIGSLNGTALTAPELERLLLLLDREPALRGAALRCFADSGLPGAFDRLQDIALHDPDPALRELAAARLEGRADDETFRLLDAMMADPSPAVRERAARSMAARGGPAEKPCRRRAVPKTETGPAAPAAQRLVRCFYERSLDPGRDGDGAGGAGLLLCDAGGESGGAVGLAGAAGAQDAGGLRPS